MSAEEKIIELFNNKFPFMEKELFSVKNERVISPALNREKFTDVFKFAVDQAGFTVFHLIIGVDDGDDLGFIYVLSNEAKIMLLLKQSAPKSDPVIKSICEIFPNALWHERELVDLFGAMVTDLPPGPTYPLPDGWPAGNYPLRKEWLVENFDRETMTYNAPAEKEEEAHE